MTVEEMLNIVVPAPFVKGQRLKLRECTIQDIRDAARVLEVTDGDPEQVHMLKDIAHRCRSLATNTLVHAAYVDLAELAEMHTKKKKEKKGARKTT